MIDPRKFGITVAANNNLTANVFTAATEALAWLRNLPGRENSEFGGGPEGC